MILQSECHPCAFKETSSKFRIMNNISHQKPIAPKLIPSQNFQDQNQIHQSSTSSLIMAESTVSSTVQAGNQGRGGNNSTGGGARRKIAFMHPTLGYPIAAPLPAKVARRNARERNRVKQVNCGFEVLRNHIPSAAKQKKMSKVDTLRHAVDYIEKLQTILKEQQIDINVSTCGRKGDATTSFQDEDDGASCKSIDSSSSVASSIERNSSSQNRRSLKLNNRTKNGRNGSQRENKPIASKSVARANLPPPLIMLPKTNQSSMSPYNHHSQHQHQQQSPPTPSSHSNCSSPVVNSPLLGPNHQTMMNFNQSNNLNSNHQNYRPPLTPRTPSNTPSSNINSFCQFLDGSPSPGAVASPSIITNESGYDSMSASFYHSPTSPQSQEIMVPHHTQMIQQSPLRQMAEQQQHQQNLSSPQIDYHHNYQQGYEVPCTPPASSIHSHPTIYNNGQHLPNRASFGCESVPDVNDSFVQGNSRENSSRFDFDYTTSATDEDELLDVIAKWQET